MLEATIDNLRKIFHNLCKIVAFERKTVKILLFEPDFTDFNALFLCFMVFPAHFHAQLFWRDNLPTQRKRF